MKNNAKLKIFSGFLIPVLVLTGFFVWVSAARAEWADHLVISEIQTVGTTVDDEFIELYNPTNLAVDISDWSIQYRGGGATTYKRKNFVAGLSIPPHGYFLIAHGTDYICTVPYCMLWSQSLSGTGGTIFLVNNHNDLSEDADNSPIVIDKVAYGTGTQNYLRPEASEFLPAPLANQSIERKANHSSTTELMSVGGADELLGNGWDTNNNSADFVLRTIPDPQNASSPVEPAIENPPTPTSDPAPSPEASASPSANPYIPPQSVPAAEAGSDKETIVGESVDFDGSDSFDPQGKELTFSWSFGDGESGQGENAHHTYNSAGEYKVVLKVDNGVASGEDSLKVKVSEPEFSDKIILSEILPDPKGSDKEGEWIELANTGDKRVNLRGWILDDRPDGGSKPYTFKEDVFIEPQDFLIVKRQESRLVLPNKGGELNIFWYDGKNLSKVSYGAAKEGQSYALINGAWQWATDVTPEEKNVLSQPVSKTAGKASVAKMTALDGKQNVDLKTGGVSIKSEEVAVRDEGDNSSGALAAEQAEEAAGSQEEISLPNKEGSNTLENNKLEINSKDLIAGELGGISGLENGEDLPQKNNNETKNNPWFWGDMALSALSLFLVWRYQELKKRIK